MGSVVEGDLDKMVRETCLLRGLSRGGCALCGLEAARKADKTGMGWLRRSPSGREIREAQGASPHMFGGSNKDTELESNVLRCDFLRVLRLGPFEEKNRLWEAGGIGVFRHEILL